MHRQVELPDATQHSAHTLPAPARVLIVDDVPEESNASAFALSVNGYEVHETSSPLKVVALARKWNPDVIILDIGMPELDGITLAHDLREDGCDAELMFVTGDKEMTTKVRGLDVAEQYLTKPYFHQELLAMVGSLVRRRRRPLSKRHALQEPDAAAPVFDSDDGRVFVPNGRDARLTNKERLVLRMLVAARGATVTKAELLRDIWNQVDGDNSVVEVNICRLRKKIEINPRQPELIITAAGGYYYNLRS